MFRFSGAVTSYDFGQAQDSRAGEAVRVLDRNDSHRFSFETQPENGQRLALDQGNERSTSTSAYLPHLSRSPAEQPAAFPHQLPG